MNQSGNGQKEVAFESTFDPTIDSVSYHVTETVAMFKEVDAIDLNPLYRAVDSDALDRLFDQSSLGRSFDGVVTFGYEGLDVAVRGDGTVQLGEPE